MATTVVRQRTRIVSQPDAQARPKTSLQEVDKLLTADEPLDTQEQEKAIELFEEAQLREARQWKGLFGVAAGLLAAFFLYALVQQIQSPYSVRYTGEFKAVVSNQQLQAALLLQGCALLLSSAGLLRSMPPRGQRERGCMPPSMQQRVLLYLGLLGSTLGALFWAGKLRALAVHREEGISWELSWLSFGPLAISALCVYVLHTLDSTARQVTQLRAYMYSFKKV